MIVANGRHLIRTVDHVFENGDETVLQVHALVTHDGQYGSVAISDECEVGQSVMIHDVEQAKRLHRAIMAAAYELGWEMDDD